MNNLTQAQRITELEKDRTANAKERSKDRANARNLAAISAAAALLGALGGQGIAKWDHNQDDSEATKDNYIIQVLASPIAEDLNTSILKIRSSDGATWYARPAEDGLEWVLIAGNNLADSVNPTVQASETEDNGLEIEEGVQN